MKISIKELKRLIKNKKRKLDEAHQVGLEVGRSEMPRDAQTWQKLANQFEEMADEAIKKQKELGKEYDYLKIKLEEFHEYEPQRTETINRLMRENAEHVAKIEAQAKKIEELKKPKLIPDADLVEVLELENEELEADVKALEKELETTKNLHATAIGTIEANSKIIADLSKDNEELKNQILNMRTCKNCGNFKECELDYDADMPFGDGLCCKDFSSWVWECENEREGE